MEKQSLLGHSPSRFVTKNNEPVLVIHGGAGILSKETVPPEERTQYLERLTAALLAGHKVLQEGGEAIDAVVAAVTVMEGILLLTCACYRSVNRHDPQIRHSSMLGRVPCSIRRAR